MASEPALWRGGRARPARGGGGGGGVRGGGVPSQPGQVGVGEGRAVQVRADLEGGAGQQVQGPLPRWLAGPGGGRGDGEAGQVRVGGRKGGQVDVGQAGRAETVARQQRGPPGGVGEGGHGLVGAVSLELRREQQQGQQGAGAAVRVGVEAERDAGRVGGGEGRGDVGRVAPQVAGVDPGAGTAGGRGALGARAGAAGGRV